MNSESGPHKHEEGIVNAAWFGKERGLVEGNSDGVRGGQEDPGLPKHSEAQDATLARGVAKLAEVLMNLLRFQCLHRHLDAVRKHSLME